MLLPSELDPTGLPDPHSHPPGIIDTDIADLRAGLQGDVLLPEDDTFAAAIACWAMGVRHTPLMAVLPETTADVVLAVNFARNHDLPVAVQATGHGIPLPCVGGMLINTSRMQHVSIDPATRTARVEAGVKWSAVLPLAHQHGLAPLLGSSSDIGVVGYTLGGGHGWLARKYGRAADRIRSADLVTADGNLMHVTKENHPDVLQALRGGSSNIGIVTALEFELVPVEEVYGGAVMYPLAMAADVFTAYNDWLPSLSADITSSISIMRFPPLPELPPMLQGAACVIVRACAVGDLADGEITIAPMRALGQPLIDTFGTVPFIAIDSVSMDPVDPMPVISKTVMLPSLAPASIDALLATNGPDVESPLLMVDLRHLGGAGSQALLIDDELPIDAAFSIYAAGVAFDDVSRTAIDGALEELHTALAPFASPRVLLNFLGDADCGEERTRAAYSETSYRRLQDVKATLDPGNRFRFNHNIDPTNVGTTE